MATFLAAKRLNALYPVDGTGEGVMRTLAQGEVVSLELKRPRNIKHHRLFWALMTLVWENMDSREYPTVEDLVTEVKIITGHYDKRFITMNGERYTVLTPKSINFASMDQPEFTAFFERVCDWVASTVLPGVTQEELRQELEVMAGARG